MVLKMLFMENSKFNLLLFFVNKTTLSSKLFQEKALIKIIYLYFYQILRI